MLARPTELLITAGCKGALRSCHRTQLPSHDLAYPRRAACAGSLSPTTAISGRGTPPRDEDTHGCPARPTGATCAGHMRRRGTWRRQLSIARAGARRACAPTHCCSHATGPPASVVNTCMHTGCQVPVGTQPVAAICAKIHPIPYLILLPGHPDMRGRSQHRPPHAATRARLSTPQPRAALARRAVASQPLQRAPAAARMRAHLPNTCRTRRPMHAICLAIMMRRNTSLGWQRQEFSRACRTHMAGRRCAALPPACASWERVSRW